MAETPRAARLAAVLVFALAAAVVIAMAILWPTGERVELTTQSALADTESAVVEAVEERRCQGLAGTTCRTFEIRLASGPDEGERTSFTLQATPPLDPEIHVGDELRVIKQTGEELSYRFADFDRTSTLLWLGLAFCALVVTFGRLRGALSLVGLAVGLVIVLVFVVPAIAQGEPALAVAIVGSLAAMLVTITLAHGLGPKSLAAILGTAATLLLVGLLAFIATELTNLTGLSEEGSLALSFQLGISLEGLLLAGMVIGTLGVLDDVTVSQASTVLALRAANPSLRFAGLYRRAIEVGRDHVSAAVNTLVFAYAGAALPVLIVFSTRDFGFVGAVNLEVVAKEVVAMLVGSIGLIAAVPLTTALASLFAERLPAEQLDAEELHGHSH